MRNKGLLHYLPHRNLDVCNVPDSAIEITGVLRASLRQKELTGKSRGGGVCFFINNSWCDERNLHSIKSFCSPDLEFHMFLCRPLWLPREFTSIIITDVCIPPQVNTDQALKELYGNISEQETVHPDCLCTQIALVVTGHFTKANFRTIAPKYFQHITINKRSDRAMDHCYSPFWDTYKSLPHFRQIGSHDDTTVISLITENDETAYREEVRTMTKWCQKNHLSLNIDKTKELVVDFRISMVIQPSRHLWSGWTALSSSAFISLRISHGLLTQMQCWRRHISTSSSWDGWGSLERAPASSDPSTPALWRASWPAASPPGLETAPLATAGLCKGSCELPATLLEVSFPPSRTSTPGGV